MLDGLQNILWNQLSHAYGSATDVPDLLRALASDQKDVRDEAIYELYSNLWHQGTVYEATAYAVPFLIELLNAPSIFGKDQILSLLEALSTGSSFLDAHQVLDRFHNERNTEEFQADRLRELEWVKAAHREVLNGTPVYLEMLSHSELLVRAMAPYVLATCLERVQEIEPALQRQFTLESEPVVKTSIIMALKKLWQPYHELTQRRSNQEQLNYLVNIFRDNAESPPVRFFAACFVIELGHEKFLADALPVIHETLEICGEIFSEFPWTEMPLIGESSPVLTVSEALTPQPEARLAWLLEMLDHPNPELRKDTINSLSIMCRERRSTPSAAVSRFANMIADPDSKVRQSAAQILPTMGKARHLATDKLQEYLSHPDTEVRILAQATLQKLQERRNRFELKGWLERPKTDKTPSEMIAILETRADSQSHADEIECSDAAAALGFMEPAVHDAVPVLRRALNHNNQWVRMRAARALWKITRNADEILPTLMEELRCRPAGLLIAECLGDMGRQAEVAIPTLQRIIESETRLVDIGIVDEWIDDDEAFRDAAIHALAKIQADLRSQG